MIKRMLVVLAVAATVTLTWGPRAQAFETFYAFGDSLTDTGNIFALTGGFEPPSPPYFNGRFSDGRVWVEPLADLLGIAIDFDAPDSNIAADPLFNNQAIGGAFADEGSETGALIGVRSQVSNFIAFGGSFGPDDLVIVWAGANDYLEADPNPALVVGDLLQSISDLAGVGAQTVLVPNLPNLGDTPGGAASALPHLLNVRTRTHNRLLARAVGGLETLLGIEIVLLDVNSLFVQVLADPELFGFDNTTGSCLIQLEDGTRIASGLCPEDGLTYDATGVLFWDLIHPTTAAHLEIAKAASAALASALAAP